MGKNCDIITGYKCNNFCIHCVRGKKNRQKILSLNEVLTKLKSARQRGAHRVIIQGGEPTIRPDFLDILKGVKDMGFEEIQLQTNGRMLAYSDFAEHVTEYGISEFCMSIHGPGDLHDKITQVKGSFEETMTGIKNLQRSGQSIKILLIINKYNMNYILDIARFLVGAGFDNFQVGLVNPEGIGTERIKYVVPSVADMKPIVNVLCNFFVEKNVKFFIQDMPKCMVGGFERYVLEDNLGCAEKLFPEYDVLDSEKLRKEKKTKPACEACLVYDSCEGIYREYYDEGLHKGIEPVKEGNNYL